MEDGNIQYNNVFRLKNGVPEGLEKTSEHDPHIVEDLARLLQINDLYTQEDSFVEIQRNRTQTLNEQLHYVYDESGKRIDDEYYQKRSKDILKNSRWEKEISLIQEKDKIDILMDIKNKELIIDRIKFLDDDNIPVTYLSVGIGDIDDGCNEEEEPCIFVHPEFILNDAGNIQYPEDEDEPCMIDIDKIKEIIVDNTKYTFLL